MKSNCMCACHKVLPLVLCLTQFVIGSNTGHQSASLRGALSHYEVLQFHEVKHSISKRSTDGSTHMKDVQFDVLGRHFHLRLTRHKISEGFRVVSVDQHNAETVEKLHLSDYFHGYDMADAERSKATVYFEDDHTMLATIEEPGETYNIEPAWRHIDDSAKHSMIAYKKSHLNMTEDLGQKFCQGVKVDAPSNHGYQHDHDEDAHHHAGTRIRRQAPSHSTYTPARNTCPLYLVADYRFFQNMGEKNVRRTTSYLLSLVDRIDQIYRRTNFSSGLVGMGFEVKEIKIHKAASTVVGGIHYNMDRQWDTKELLEAFSEDLRNVAFCLGHLFTAIKFREGTLGLSYVASQFYGDPGGICSHQVYYKGGRQLYLNTGWSSSINRYDRRLLTEEALLVTTHEFGHNWGSEHDPDTDECSPNAFGGGKYIMYTYSVSGYDQNNKIFSNCSRRNIGAVLQAKAPKCFEEQSGSFCGNFRIDPGLRGSDDEECDAGPSGRHGADPCCNEICKLRKNAECSDANHECCSNCRFMSSQNVCHKEQEDSCEGTAHCTGNHGTCPKPKPRLDGSDCINRGKCHAGVCISLCESEGRHSCVCDRDNETCFWCCKDSFNAECKPHENNYTLPSGTSCLTGYCDGQGICEKQEQDLIQRLWDIIENITPDKLVEFMRANIVGTVIILSLVVWIPASCIVCYYDRRKKRDDDKQRDWMKHDNDSLILDEEEQPKNTGLRLRRIKGLKSKKPIHLHIPREAVRRPDNVMTTFI